jgi:hypothetical protein
MEIFCNLVSSLAALSYQLLSVQVLPLVMELVNGYIATQGGFILTAYE